MADLSVKLQVPVTRDLANELARWAQSMEWTQARLGAVLLDFGSEDFAKVGRWMKVRATKARNGATGLGWLQTGNRSAVRLQLLVTKETAQRIELLANSLNQTSVRMAALLLDFALCDERWGMRVFSTTFGKAILKVFGKKPELYESAEVDDDTAEEDETL
jgi:hypothetical protein